MFGYETYVQYFGDWCGIVDYAMHCGIEEFCCEGVGTEGTRCSMRTAEEASATNFQNEISKCPALSL